MDLEVGLEAVAPASSDAHTEIRYTSLACDSLGSGPFLIALLQDCDDLLFSESLALHSSRLVAACQPENSSSKAGFP